MNPVTITQAGMILAEQVDEPSLSNDRPMWHIQEANPAPGPATWSQRNGWSVKINIISVVNGWLVARRPDGLLIGIVWSDGTYYANWLRDARGGYTKHLSRGAYVEGDEGFGQSRHVILKGEFAVLAVNFRTLLRRITRKKLESRSTSSQKACSHETYAEQGGRG